MKVPLAKVLGEGMSFSHLYDYGDTTYLKLSVKKDLACDLATGEKIRLLARNDPPPISCHTCGEEATVLCLECQGAKGWVLCDDCLATHECGDEFTLPIVNSPRVGQCGYEG